MSAAPTPRPIDTAPKDGTMVRLLVDFEEHSTEDDERAWTIGANYGDHSGEDRWQFAGWCWNHDHFTEGKGTAVGWLPLHGEPGPVSGEGRTLSRWDYLAEFHNIACTAVGMAKMKLMAGDSDGALRALNEFSDEADKLGARRLAPAPSHVAGLEVPRG